MVYLLGLRDTDALPQFLSAQLLSPEGQPDGPRGGVCGCGLWPHGGEKMVARPWFQHTFCL